MKNNQTIPTDVHVRNFNEAMRHMLHASKGRTAFRYREKDEVKAVTYERFVSEAKALGDYFNSLGLQGEKIALIGENSYLWLVTFYAAMSSGNVIVPLDNQLLQGEVIPLLNNSDSVVFVYSNNYTDLLEPARAAAPKVQHFLNIKTDIQPLLRSAPTVSEDDPYFSNCSLQPGDLAALVYTSGTTGKPKGVMLSHYNLISVAISGSKQIDVTNQDTLAFLPMHHTLTHTNIIGHLLRGGCVAINSGIKTVAKDFLEFKPEYVIAVPLVAEMLYKRIWETAKSQKKDKTLKIALKVSNALMKFGIDLRRRLFKDVLDAFGGRLRWIGCGGAAIQKDLLRAFRSLGVEAVTGYGTSECSPGISLSSLGDKITGHSGRIMDCCEVKVMDKDSDGVGEFYVRGTNVMLGYYKDPEATAEVFDGEWFKTGDLGYIDDEGFLYVTGRKKNLIVLSNGKNVAPEELEMKLLTIPYIAEVLVYSEGDKIVAEVFLDKENHPGCEEQLENDMLELNRSLPQYKYIAKTIIRDKEFPKTTTRKIKRR